MNDWTPAGNFVAFRQKNQPAGPIGNLDETPTAVTFTTASRAQTGNCERPGV
jgi:hypothetical protein